MTMDPTAVTEAVMNMETAATESSLDLESIKELMDGLDPAALLPELDTIFSKVLLACRIAVMVGPLILLILGIGYLLLAPKEANYYFGYRCYFGMGSPRAWRFTQRIAGILFGLLGLVLSIVMYLNSKSFASMELMDMVWKALRCVIWQAGLALGATVLINLVVFLCFNARGDLRRAKKKQK